MNLPAQSCTSTCRPSLYGGTAHNPHAKLISGLPNLVLAQMLCIRHWCAGHAVHGQVVIESDR